MGSETDFSHLVDLSLDDVKIIVRKYSVDKKLSKSAYMIKSYKIQKLSEEAVGFLGDHYLLNVFVKDKCVKYDEALDDEDEDFDEAEVEIEKEEEVLSFFIKALPEHSPGRATYMHDFRVFEKESKMFRDLLPRLQDVGIGNNSWAAKCYMVKNNNLLILENLIENEFRIDEFGEGLFDFNHLEVALRALAEFHAASIVVELRNNKTIPQLYPNILTENAYDINCTNLRHTHFTNAIQVCCEIIKVLPKYKDSPDLIKILNDFPKLIKKMYDFAIPSTKYRNVVNHADLWKNNIMFKYSEQSAELISETRLIECEVHRDPSLDTITIESLEKIQSERKDSTTSGRKMRTTKTPIACRLVDFQLCRYAPPALDVMTLICMTTTNEFRKNNSNNLIEIYYEALSKELDRNEFDGIDVLPFETFQESCEYFTEAGLIETALFGHMILLPPDAIKDITSSSEAYAEFVKTTKIGICMEVFETHDVYRNRMSEVISLLVDNHILN